MAEASGERRKRKKKPDDVVMQGMTEEERRLLRQEQRSLHERMVTRKQEMVSLESDTFVQMKDDNNELFKKVRYTREAHYDSTNLKELTQNMVKRAEQLTTSSSTYSADKLISALHAKGWNDELHSFNWRGLGLKVAALSRSPPEMNFMCGAIDKPEKVKKAREKKAKPDDDDEVETGYKEVTGQEEVEDEATTRRAEEMNKVGSPHGTRARLCGYAHIRPGASLPRALPPPCPGQVFLERMAQAQAAHGSRSGEPTMEVLPLLVNPSSFHQTVENFFDFSFRIKQGLSNVKIDANGLPVTTITSQPNNAAPKTQVVVALTMQNLAAVSDAWKIAEPGMPHRSFVDRSGASSGGGAASGAASSARGGTTRAPPGRGRR